jgi:hypothetical protein
MMREAKPLALGSAIERSPVRFAETWPDEGGSPSQIMQAVSWLKIQGNYTRLHSTAKHGI